MDDNVLRVGATVDIAGIESGMPAAATVVERNLQRMADAFAKLQSAARQSQSAILDWTGAPFQKPTEEAKKLAGGVEKIGAASEKSGFSMRYAFFGLKDLAEGRYRFATAELANELMRMGGTALVVGGVAAAIGGIAYAIVEVKSKLKEMVEEPNKIHLAFEELNTTLQTSIDELGSENARLADTLAKLEGEPTNGLAAALEDAYVESDKLNQSLTKNLENIEKVLKKNHVGGFMNAILGVQGTDDIEKWFDKYQAAMRQVDYAGSQNVHKAITPEGIKAAQAEWDRAIADMRSDAQSKIAAWIADAQKPHPAGKGSIFEQNDRPEERAARLAALQELSQSIQLEGDLGKAMEKNADLKGKVAQAEAGRAGVEQMSRQVAIQERQIENEKKIALTHLQIVEDTARQKRQIGEIELSAETAALQAAENRRYQIELDAANRINALKAKVAAAEHRPAEQIDTGVLTAEHDKRSGDIANRAAVEQKKADDQMAGELASFMERVHKEAEAAAERGEKELERIGEEGKKNAERVAQTNEQAEIAHATRVYQKAKELIDLEFADHQISARKRIELLKAIEKQEYETQMAAATKEYQGAVKDHGVGSPEVAQSQAKLQQIADQYSATMAKLNADSKKNATIIVQTYTSMADAISGAFNHAFEDMLEKHKKFGAAITASFRQVADQAIMNIIRMTEQMLIAAALHKASAAKTAMVDAKTAAVGAFRSVMTGVPFPVNVVLAPIAAAATFAGAMAFATFEEGGIVPKTQMSLVHGGERVLTPDQNRTYEQIAERGGGGDTHNHYHAAPGESPNSVTANAAAFRRAMRDGHLSFA